MKTVLTIESRKRVPEWGISDTVSTAVPLVASGAEFKSTRDVGEAMSKVLRSKLDSKALSQVKKFAKKERSSGIFFKTARRRANAMIARKRSK
jgi:hypothetical protein